MDLNGQIQAVRKRQFRGSNGGALRNIYPLRRIAVCDRCNHPMYGEPHLSALYMACGTQRGEARLRPTRCPQRAPRRSGRGVARDARHPGRLAR
jgi:hypothetical protein